MNRVVSQPRLAEDGDGDHALGDIFSLSSAKLRGRRPDRGVYAGGGFAGGVGGITTV